MIRLRHVMIDLETMGAVPEMAIVSIGAVLFDPRFGKLSKESFYVELAWEDQGRYICDNTKQWWSQQSKEAQAALNGLEGLEESLIRLANWLPKDCKVWGNGAAFDISCLEHAYRQLGINIPWKFWNVRDCRTILDMYESLRGGLNKTANRQGYHNALEDAKYQANYVNMMWNKILGEKTCLKK